MENHQQQKQRQPEYNPTSDGVYIQFEKQNTDGRKEFKRFCVVAVVLAAFPDSVLNLLFPNGMVPFHQVGRGALAFSVNSSASAINDLIDPQSPIFNLAAVENHKFVSVPLGHKLDFEYFVWLVYEVRDLLMHKLLRHTDHVIEGYSNNPLKDSAFTIIAPDIDSSFISSIDSNSSALTGLSSILKIGSIYVPERLERANVPAVIHLTEELDFYCIPQNSSENKESQQPVRNNQDSIKASFIARIFPNSYTKLKASEIHRSTIPKTNPEAKIIREKCAEFLKNHHFVKQSYKSDVGENSSKASKSTGEPANMSVSKPNPNTDGSFRTRGISFTHENVENFAHSVKKRISRSIISHHENEVDLEKLEEVGSSSSSSSNSSSSYVSASSSLRVTNSMPKQISSPQKNPQVTFQHLHFIEALSQITTIAQADHKWGHRRIQISKTGSLVSVCMLDFKPSVTLEDPYNYRPSETSAPDSTSNLVTQVQDISTQFGAIMEKLTVDSVAASIKKGIPFRKVWWEVCNVNIGHTGDVEILKTTQNSQSGIDVKLWLRRSWSVESVKISV
ncbi:hypothetical protein HK100_001876 [Physocladia obscura]|uniref:Uncharacterized protein n=1 Tax=Physocladia obscura TaxID=109957 RepID=A0AAD5SW87_9FUNG|nr:hypothetical protein HK100_001876 [Physocladia obscura]